MVSKYIAEFSSALRINLNILGSPTTTSARFLVDASMFSYKARKLKFMQPLPTCMQRSLPTCVATSPQSRLQPASSMREMGEKNMIVDSQIF